MKYRIFVTRRARLDILSAYSYIADTLQNRKTADDLIGKAADVIDSLEELPERYSLVSDPVLSSWGIRTAQVDNYTIFYTANKKERRVYIVRLLYSRRNWASLVISKDTLD